MTFKHFGVPKRKLFIMEEGPFINIIGYEDGAYNKYHTYVKDRYLQYIDPIWCESKKCGGRRTIGIYSGKKRINCMRCGSKLPRKYPYPLHIHEDVHAQEPNMAERFKHITAQIPPGSGEDDDEEIQGIQQTRPFRKR